ncbi:hypothetical protein ACFY2R_27715 [Micromonospora olivasterospora]|uniref:Uncharacterized protein n=1 Tax=Micromonospora olivasterospora TaxID=1880 RepID=A0A562IF27_MICOL|nr:hypothetical protein [Micromonospora olivasterospora]TWH69512.1 hypothetical protein JD77_04522 [Micromonospora olivasterospora]
MTWYAHRLGSHVVALARNLSKPVLPTLVDAIDRRGQEGLGSPPSVYG